MVNLDLNNRFIARFFRLVSERKTRNSIGYFFNTKKLVSERLYMNRGEIISTRRICFKELFKDADEQKWLSIFLDKNKALLDENGVLEQSLTDELVELLLKAKELDNETGSKTELLESTRHGFKDVVEPEDEDLDFLNNEELIKSKDEDIFYLKPSQTFSFTSFMMNYFYSNKIRYVFNNNVLNNSVYNDNLTIRELEVLSFMEEVRIPVKYKVICTHRSEMGEECGNIVFFSEVHKNSTIYCTDSLEDSNILGTRHTVKNIENATVVEQASLYAYNVRDVETEKEMVVYSVEELESTHVKVNIVNGGKKNSQLMLVIAQQKLNKFVHALKEPFLLKHERNKGFFLHDLIDSSKKYLKDYHNVSLNYSNRVVGEYMLLQYLSNVYLDYAFRAGYFGKSGAGKSIWAKLLLPLFTNSIAIVEGSEVTRNRLLGGKGNHLSNFFASPYTPGYIATHDVVFLEEMTNQLSDFHEGTKAFGKGNLSGNVFSLLKGKDEKGQEYDVGIQGSQKSRVRASTILVGNLEQLASIKEEYKRLVYKKYKLFNRTEGGPNFSSRWPMYKPVEYYSKDLKNVALAKAHMSARKELLTKNYVTLLPEAEQARLAIMIILEDNESGYVPRILTKEERLKTFVHREDIKSELDKVFANKPLPNSLFKEVNVFLEEELFRNRNNFVIDKTIDYNIHLRAAVVRLMSALVWLNKLYWVEPGTEPDTSLTTEDKELIEYYSLFNYNTLNRDEASMTKKPYINDLFYDTDEVHGESTELVEQERIEELKELITKQGAFVKGVDTQEDVFDKADKTSPDAKE